MVCIIRKARIEARNNSLVSLSPRHTVKSLVKFLRKLGLLPGDRITHVLIVGNGEKSLQHAHKHHLEEAVKVSGTWSRKRQVSGLGQ